MHRLCTLQNAFRNKGSALFPKVFILLFLLLVQTVSLFANYVDYYTSCGYVNAGSTVTATAQVRATNSSTNYAWQFRDNSNVWKCFTSGSNTINGVTFTVSGVSARGQNVAPALSIANSTIALNNVDVRLLLADGTNALPCASNPPYTVYGTDKSLKLHILTGSDCANIATYCSGGTPAVLKLGDLIWNDINGNGVKDSDEPGVPNATIKLYADNNNDNVADGAAIATTTTNASGIYAFSQLKSGNYIVGVTIPVGYTKGPASTIDPDNNVNNDNNGVNLLGANQAGSEVRSKAITLTASGEPTADGDDSNSNLTLDIALCGNSQIGDFVWNDKNANGIQDVNEPGLQGATVKLTFPDGVTTRTTTTDANGKYLFIALAPGNYKVTFTTPAGFTPSAANQGTDDAKDSDPVKGIANITVAPGTNNLSVDAGFYSIPAPPPTTGCPGNMTTCNSGYYGGFEAGGSNLSSTTGGSDLYNGLPRNGSYQIVQSVDELGGGGYLDIHPRSGSYFLASHTSNDESDRIWYTKVAVTPGQTVNFCAAVTLLKNLGNGAEFILGVYANGTQIGTGRVTFDWTQICGTYTVPAGVTSLELSLRDPKKGLFFVAIDDICITTTPPPARLTLGNQVWNDKDGDGHRDPNEEGISGITVSLYTDNNGDNKPDGAAIKTTKTDVAGRYAFTGLPEGRYIASIPVLRGYLPSPSTRTSQNPNPALNTSQEPDNNVNDDNNAIYKNASVDTMYTHAITLTPGQEPENNGNTNNTLDLALCGNGGIGDFVWNDTNGNGIQDAGETGINGVVVTITFEDGTTATDTTHNYIDTIHHNVTPYDGFYDFINLGGGTFKISFATPVGLHPSPAKQGNDDTKDSDPVNGSVMVTLAPNGSNFNIDAGFTDKTPTPPPVTCPNLSVGNMVFLDLNGNGTKEVHEPGIGGLTVKLYTDNDGNNVADGAAISTLMTAADGTYYFGNLTAGKYIVGVALKDSLIQGANGNPNPDDDKDNDNNGVKTVNGEVFSNAITLSAGNEPINDGSDNNSNLTLDFALKMRSTTPPPCSTHCECHNDCDHEDNHPNCGHNKCHNDCDHKDNHPNCGHNSCKNDCDHNDDHANCGKKDKNKDKDKESSRAASSESQSVVAAITNPELTSTTVSVFPNPANDYIVIKVMAAKAGKGLARITDLSGKLVATKTAVINNGMNLIKFDKIAGLNAGTYFVQLDFNYHTYNQQLIVGK